MADAASIDYREGMTPGGEAYRWLEELNPQQRQAVTHPAGPLLIVAGAGTGKTKTLAYRVAYLISQGIDPARILLLTFTRRAAHEMLRRAGGIVTRGTSATGRVWGGTFHAAANRLLRTYAGAVGLERDFTVLDAGDAQDLIHLIRHDLGLHKQEKRFPRKSTCLSIYSRCVNTGDDLEHVLEHEYPWCAEWGEELRELFRRYVARKQERSVLDFDDLLLYWSLLVEGAKAARELSALFDVVLIDEYQDTNLLQAKILRGMRTGNDNITVVGDDAQSIYRFRGATVRNILDFPKQFPGTTIIALERNYRSTMPILETANRLIAAAPERYTKDLWSDEPTGTMPQLVTCTDETRQDGFVIERVLEHYEAGIPLHRQAVLFRAAHLSDSLEIELARRNIPYHKYGGLRFLEAAHVKDLVAFLRLLENPRDELAWFRVLQMLEGIGPTTAARVIEHVGEHHDDPRSIASFSPPSAAQEAFTGLVELVGQLVPMGTTEPAEQIERIRAFYDPLLRKLYENPYVRVRDLISLEQIATGYRSRQQFLVDLQLDPPTSTADLAGVPNKDEDWLVLSTIHSAKGCEWDVVYLIHAADGFLPSDLATGSAEEIDEERRLTYVALTRAKRDLYVTWPLRYYHKWYALSDRHTYAQVCRFFGRDVVRTMETPEVGDDVSAETGPGESRPPFDAELDVAERVRRMWESYDM